MVSNQPGCVGRPGSGSSGGSGCSSLGFRTMLPNGRWYTRRVQTQHMTTVECQPMRPSPLINFGTSTRTYEGWQGQVCQRNYPKTRSAKSARRGLLRTVGNRCAEEVLKKGLIELTLSLSVAVTM